MSQKIINQLGHLPVVAVIAALTNDEDSLPKLKFVEVDTTDDFYFEVAPNDLDAEQIFKTLIELDDAGDPAIRIGFHSTTDSTKMEVSELAESQLLRKLIGKTAEGKPYLRATLQELA